MDVITKIVNEWDPMELLSFSPKDEYYIEIEMIKDKFNKKVSIEDLSTIIIQVFTETFGEDIFREKKAECYMIAEKILKSMG